ncbi:right-handed parallel beta-helix repeat-containing protein [Verrucomicrobiota bacterium]
MKENLSGTFFVAVVLAGLAVGPMVRGEDIVVSTSDDLRAAIGRAGPGTTIKLAPGRYSGGFSLEEIVGRHDAPVILAGIDSGNPPVLSGGHEALHLSDCRHVVIRDIKVSGSPVNGINADDGGTFDTPSRHLLFERVTIENTGGVGNHDALKLSGVDNFTVRDCTFRGWGGSAIDMVRCQDGRIEDCSFHGAPGFSQSTGIQMKGGTTRIAVVRSFFRDAGNRAVHIGGQTDPDCFRPGVPDYEAKDIVVAGNRFVGSDAVIAWVTADGGHVHHNTIVLPSQWVLRILQETAAPRFAPCRGGVFEDNLIVYDGNVRASVNVGPGTTPGSFVFRRNAWYRADGPTKVRLPAPEQDGVYGVDPKLVNSRSRDMTVTSLDPRIAHAGADRYREAP